MFQLYSINPQVYHHKMLSFRKTRSENVVEVTGIAKMFKLLFATCLVNIKRVQFQVDQNHRKALYAKRNNRKNYIADTPHKSSHVCSKPK